jgi:8-oxo-dGTP pyrophosphatase MutT (NUDIX family)
MPKIRLLARGVLRSGRFVLLAHNRRKAHTFLPGGRIEPGESARAALAREFREETGLEVRVGAFLGAVEHTWREQGKRHQELNLIFEVTVRGLDRPKPVPSREEHLEFLWRDLSRLAAARLQPAPLRRWLPRVLRGGHRPLWASTLSR